MISYWLFLSIKFKEGMMNKKLLEAIREKVLRDNMTVDQTIEYVWDLKKEDE